MIVIVVVVVVVIIVIIIIIITIITIIMIIILIMISYPSKLLVLEEDVPLLSIMFTWPTQRCSTTAWFSWRR